ncbi:hypothetical protein [Agromyces sp. NPDC049794]|uniref:hypothetical protein n=1 Tax=unclassified Agromyces TaxID=2639701 RepID=UPI0033FB08AD
MKRVITGILLGGMLIGATGCAASSEPSEPAETAAAPTAVPASEDGDTGLCHSVSVALTVLEDAQGAYADATLDRDSFNVVAASVAKSFELLRTMHDDADLLQEAEALGSAVGDLATAEGEPAFGDTSDLGQRRSALAAGCDQVDAPLSIYQ